jgi:hypothetical protein
MAAIKLILLDNLNLRISIENEDDFKDIISRKYSDERHFLADMMDESGYIGNNWECCYEIGLTEAPAIAEGLIYSEKDDNDGYPIDYENLWYFGDYMTVSFIEVLKIQRFVDFTAHTDNIHK